MKNIYIIRVSVFTLLLSIFCGGCDQTEIASYDNEYDGIAFYIAGDNSEADSLSYSFAYNTEQLQTDTIFIKMRLVGKLKDTDRAIKVVADNGTTAQEGVHYKLPQIVLPAGQGYVNYPLVLYNTEDLKTTDYTIKLKIEPSDDLKIGALGREIGTTTITSEGTASIYGTTMNLDHYAVKFNNKLSKPDYWDYLVHYGYGTFSITKFQFMLKILGAEAMNNVKEWEYNQYFSYKVRLQVALIEYEASNGTLLDENGIQVKFSS